MIKNKEKKEVIQMSEAKKIQDLPGVGAATAEKLESAGFRDLMSVAVATLGELVETAGVSEAEPYAPNVNPAPSGQCRI